MDGERAPARTGVRAHHRRVLDDVLQAYDAAWNAPDAATRRQLLDRSL
ncbi:MAG TPA: hypothetical protein VG474_16105 [Solirubrobacteraceae bacterium]|nr:hypothetical protein [Solirubrobacteraceae bacterium]